MVIVVVIIVGLFAYFRGTENNQSKADDKVWYKSEKVAISKAKNYLPRNLVLLQSTRYISNVKAIPAYFRDKKAGEGFIIIDIQKKNKKYAVILSNAGMSYSYPPGIPDSVNYLPALDFSLKTHKYKLFFGKTKKAIQTIHTKNSDEKFRFIRHTDIYYRLEETT
jgi:hypothetical protein